jgi:hypothetical protein
MANGFGYEITSIDVLDAFHALTLAWQSARKNSEELKSNIKKLIADTAPHSDFVGKILMPYFNRGSP